MFNKVNNTGRGLGLNSEPGSLWEVALLTVSNRHVPVALNVKTGT